MLKPNSTYKMSKQTKRTLALTGFKSQEQRDGWKRAMIDAELCSKIVVKAEKRDRNAPRGATANYVTNDTGTASTQA
jgi:hypothetical protein